MFRKLLDKYRDKRCPSCKSYTVSSYADGSHYCTACNRKLRWIQPSDSFHIWGFILLFVIGSFLPIWAFLILGAAFEYVWWKNYRGMEIVLPDDWAKKDVLHKGQ